MKSLDADTLSALRSGFHSREEIEALTRAQAVNLRMPQGESAASFLLALSGVESSFGANAVPRYEFAYGPGGLYYQKNKDLKALYSDFGALASCSYGPWQLMFVVARELGYQGHPLALFEGAISLPYVVKYLNGMTSKGVGSVEGLAATYNGGFGALQKPSDAVKSYTQKVRKLYSNFKSINQSGEEN